MPGNRYFTRRIDTAAELYHAGKVKWLLVSGDNGRKNYDEASGMQQALIAKGVPAKVIFCDYAGFSTLDSVVRANKVFGRTISPLSRRNFITNAPSGWQNNTASMLSGLTHQTRKKDAEKIVRLREKLARVSAVIDAKIFNRQPKYLGPSVIIGPFSEHGCPAQK